MISRRRLLTLSAMLAATPVTACGTGSSSSSPSSSSPAPAHVVAPPPEGVLAANLNQNLDSLRFDELEYVRASWVRGFYSLRQGNDTSQLASLLTAANAGYGTVLNLKFDYPQGLPRAGSDTMTQLLRRLDDVLAATMGTMSIVVVGNEPFYECGKDDRTSAAINTFYEQIAQHVLDYRGRTCGTGCRTEIYLGALTDLNDPQGRTPQTERWMEFVRTTPALAGTDCHPHVPSLEDGQRYLDYVVPRLGTGQKFLATEFSLIKLYREHMKDRVPAAYAARRHLPAATPVWQVLRDFLRKPVPQAQWMDFLTSCPWFADTQTFLTDMVTRFRQSGRCAVAAYGITQDAAMSQDFGPDSSPWILNSVFCPHTVQPGPDGLPGQNMVWAQQFRSAQGQ